MKSRPAALMLARTAWAALLALTLGLFLAAIPARFEELLQASRRAGADWADLFPDGGNGVLAWALSAGAYPFIVLALEISFVAAFTVVSGMMVWRRSHDWRTLLFSAAFLTYSVWVTPTLDALSLGGAGRYVVSLTQAVALVLAIHILLLFPDGRFVPGWTRISSIAWTIYTLAWGLYPDAWFSLIDPFEASVPAFLALMFGGWIIGLIAQAMRYRRSPSAEQRSATRWVLLTILAAVIGYGAVYLPGVLLPDAGAARFVYDYFGVPTFWLLAMPIPAALAVALLRHHLFDFPAAASRVLVYGFLTATLGLVYVGAIAVLQPLFRPVTGTSDLPVVGSTLLVAVLFRPVRGRFQSFIDRRFHRARYDAARTVERFNARLRDRVDLDALNGELLGTVHQTMQPAHASLWLHSPEDRA